MTPASPERLRQRRRIKEQLAQLASNEQAMRDLQKAISQNNPYGAIGFNDNNLCGYNSFGYRQGE